MQHSEGDTELSCACFFPEYTGDYESDEPVGGSTDGAPRGPYLPPRSKRRVSSANGIARANAPLPVSDSYNPDEVPLNCFATPGGCSSSRGRKLCATEF